MKRAASYAKEMTAIPKKANNGKRSTSKERDSKYEAEQGSWILSADSKDLISILENLPYGIAVLRSRFGKALYINRKIPSLLGYTLIESPTTTAHLIRTVPNPRERSGLRKAWKKMCAAGGGTIIVQHICKDGVKRIFEQRSVVIRSNLIINMWVDVTRRETAEAQVRESETQFRSFFDTSSNPFLLAEGGSVINCNQAAEQMLGYGKHQLIGLTLDDLWYGKQPDHRSRLMKGQDVLKLASSQDRGLEWKLRRIDGKEVPVEVFLNSMVLQGRHLHFIVLKDITKWKEAENMLLHAKADLEKSVRERTSDLTALNKRLRKEIEARKKTEQQLRRSREELRLLSEYLQRVREEDRVYVAREIHDELGQSLSAMKIDLAFLKQELAGKNDGLEEKVLDIEKQVGATIESVRNICKELRPPIFDDLGLSVAIRWHLKEFEKRTGIRCIAAIDEQIRQDGELALVIFRVFQEAMTNIMRHAQATEVHVWLNRAVNNIVLKVKDNGKGISPQQIADPFSLGIVGTKERARFWGGKSSFTAAPGRGTTMTVSIPLDGRKVPFEVRQKK